MQIPKLRQWREARALTQGELAEKAGVSARSVAGYEAGAGARPGTVRNLARALEIEVVDLLEGYPKAPPLSGRTGHRHSRMRGFAAPLRKRTRQS